MSHDVSEESKINAWFIVVKDGSGRNNRRITTIWGTFQWNGLAWLAANGLALAFDSWGAASASWG